jgi:hypothetical protein
MGRRRPPAGLLEEIDNTKPEVSPALIQSHRPTEQVICDLLSDSRATSPIAMLLVEKLLHRGLIGHICGTGRG